MNRMAGSYVYRPMGRLVRLGLVLLALGAGATACGGKDKKKPTTPTGDKTGGGSDAEGMKDGDVPDGEGGVANNRGGGGGGDGAGVGDKLPGTEGQGTEGSGGGTDEPAAPEIKPPNLDISPEQARTEVDRHLRAAKGMLGQKTPDPDGAIREAQAALAVDGTSIDAIVTIAHANYHKRLYDTAEVILDGLLERRPTSQQNPYLYYVYGLVYDKMGEAPRAFAAYRQAVKLSPSYVAALINLGVHQLTNKQYADAVATYEKLTGDLDKSDAATWSSLGSAYRGMSGDYDPGSPQRDQWLAKAESAYKRSQAADRNYGPAYYNLGLLYLDADPFPTDSGPMDTLARLNRAKTYFDEYKNMPGVDMKLYDERTKDVTKLIKREEKKRAKSKKES